MLFQKLFARLVCALIALAVIFFALLFMPVSKNSGSQEFVVQKGSGLSAVADELQSEKLIRSSFVFKLIALERDRNIKAGTYEISGSQSGFSILNVLLKGPETARVVIPEGSSLYDVDDILAASRVVKPGIFASYALSTSAEGKLFPDTYEFLVSSDVKDVADTMMKNYAAKALPVIRESKNSGEELIIASLLEKEVRSFEDRKIVAGIIKKRLAAAMPIQIDATICYAKRVARATGGASSCYPLTPLDFRFPSPYNTYLNRGLPPGPIGSPGVDALQAALNAENSPYWYYLSDPVSGKTIFAKTLDEQSSNRARYLDVSQ